MKSRYAHLLSFLLSLFPPFPIPSSFPRTSRHLTSTQKPDGVGGDSTTAKSEELLVKRSAALFRYFDKAAPGLKALEATHKEVHPLHPLPSSFCFHANNLFSLSSFFFPPFLQPQLVAKVSAAVEKVQAQAS